MTELIKLTYHYEQQSLAIEVKLSTLAIIAAILFGIVLVRWISQKYLRRTELVGIELELGTKGFSQKLKYDIERNNENIYIANRIYVELVTRKAAIEIDPEKDVVEEIYKSWYQLFTTIRNEIKSVSGKSLKQKDNTTYELIELTIRILNQGLRPHLTKYQAEFLRWYENAKAQNEYKSLSPQEIQKHYVNYNELISDMLTVNKGLSDYATELRKIVHKERNVKS